MYTHTYMHIHIYIYIYVYIYIYIYIYIYQNNQALLKDGPPSLRDALRLARTTLSGGPR